MYIITNENRIYSEIIEYLEKYSEVWQKDNLMNILFQVSKMSFPKYEVKTELAIISGAMCNKVSKF